MKIRPEIEVLLDQALNTRKGIIVVSEDITHLIRVIEHTKANYPHYKAISVFTFNQNFREILLIPKHLTENRAHAVQTLRPEDLTAESLLGPEPKDNSPNGSS